MGLCVVLVDTHADMDRTVWIVRSGSSEDYVHTQNSCVHTFVCTYKVCVCFLIHKHESIKEQITKSIEGRNQQILFPNCCRKAACLFLAAQPQDNHIEIIFFAIVFGQWLKRISH